MQPYPGDGADDGNDEQEPENRAENPLQGTHIRASGVVAIRTRPRFIRGRIPQALAAFEELGTAAFIREIRFANSNRRGTRVFGEVMVRYCLSAWFVALLLSAPGTAGAEQAAETRAPETELAGTEPAETEPAEVAPAQSSEGCFPSCRSGYVCHPELGECVSICNPPCSAWEVCTAEAECVGEGDAPEAPPSKLGDMRFRVALLARIGFAGKLTSTIRDSSGGGTIKVKGKPDRATLGFDLRIEKPVARNVSVGGVLSNYWFRGATENSYALDIAPFVKPRLVFRAGKQEAEFYGLIQVGGSLIRIPVFPYIGGAPEIQTSGGFNVGIMPGFQVFMGRAAAFVVEVGYAFSWFKGRGESLQRFWVGQPTVRTGFVFAF